MVLQATTTKTPLSDMLGDKSDSRSSMGRIGRLRSCAAMLVYAYMYVQSLYLRSRSPPRSSLVLVVVNVVRVKLLPASMQYEVVRRTETSN